VDISISDQAKARIAGILFIAAIPGVEFILHFCKSPCNLPSHSHKKFATSRTLIKNFLNARIPFRNPLVVDPAMGITVLVFAPTSH
jgi:hypothetical protein